MKYLLCLLSVIVLPVLSFAQETINKINIKDEPGSPAALPLTLSYQGILTDQSGTIVPDNTYSVTFKIYDAAAGGNMLWEEMQVLPVFKGLFNAMLGKTTPLNIPFDKPYFLGITVSTGSELVPRTELTSSPYSIMSRGIVDNAITTVKISDGAVTQSKLAQGLTIPPGGTAGGDLSGTFPNPVVSKLQGRTLSNTAPTNGQVLSWNGTQWTPSNQQGGIGGNGTLNYLPLFTGSNTIGNSKLFTRTDGNHNFLELGEPTQFSNYLKINSNELGETGIIFSDSVLLGGMFYYPPEQALYFYTNSDAGYTEKMRIQGSGRVGIGNYDPVAQLDVLSHELVAGKFTSDIGNPSTTIIDAEYVGTVMVNATGIRTQVTPGDGFGYGAQLTGGYIGAKATSESATFSGVGLMGYSTGTAGTKTGVFGTADGGTTNYAVYASGDLAYTGNLLHVSDRMLKKDITDMGSTLDKVMQLEPRLFSYSDDPRFSHMNLSRGKHYGLIAQEVEKVFPEIVKDAVNLSKEETEGKRGGEEIKYKAVVETELIPILIQAVKDQQEEIYELKREIQSLKK